MTISRPTYAPREAVKARLDVKLTARMDTIVDDAIEAASGEVDRLCHRQFWPTVDTREFDWPDRQNPTSWRLWLNQHELISLTSLTAGGETIAVGDVLLYPVDGPPYTRLETDLSTSAAFTAGETRQQAVAVTGLFGHSNDETAAGTTVEALDASETAVDVSDSTAVGAGDLIRVDSERMLVTGRASLDTGQNLGGNLTAQKNAVSVTVSDGTLYTAGETLTIDSERMRVDDITGNTLTVTRAWDGSVLAAHTSGADIYAPRTLAVVRGYGGTTAATHTTATAIRRHVAPGLVRQYTAAHALAAVLQEAAGWARTAGSGEGEREAAGRGLAQLRRQVYDGYARKARMRSC